MASKIAAVAVPMPSRRVSAASAIKSTTVIGGRSPMKTQDPFLFLVYHQDHYPKGDDKMRAPRKGNGADFGADQPYRMYHGDWVPGFPQHPHRGFETITATIDGLVDHTDSMGSAGRYGVGDVQWMTAGSGVVHGEMFPLVNGEKDNPLQFFQIWINLPAKNKMVPANYVMHWAETIPTFKGDGATVWVWSGKYKGLQAHAPCKDSWANDPANEVMILGIKVAPGGSVDIPAAKTQVNRSMYICEPSKLGFVTDGGKTMETTDGKLNLTLDPTKSMKVHNTGSKEALLLVLQGKPIQEPVAQHGPFVMNNVQEIREAYSDYMDTRFGGWPWPTDAVVFPRTKGRFSLQNGKETGPPNEKEALIKKAESDQKSSEDTGVTCSSMLLGRK